MQFVGCMQLLQGKNVAPHHHNSNFKKIPKSPPRPSRGHGRQLCHVLKAPMHPYKNIFLENTLATIGLSFVCGGESAMYGVEVMASDVAFQDLELCVCVYHSERWRLTSSALGSGRSNYPLLYEPVKILKSSSFWHPIIIWIVLDAGRSFSCATWPTERLSCTFLSGTNLVYIFILAPYDELFLVQF